MQFLIDVSVNLFSDVLAILFAIVIWQKLKEFRFGGWLIIVRQDGNVLARRQISTRKAEMILEEPQDLSVYAKGVVSPFAWLKKDILTTPGLLEIDRGKKHITINIEKGGGDK